MIENLADVIMGFAATYLSLEVAWHFNACRLKEMKMVSMTSPPQAGPGRVL
jgi:hypothetical protein